MKKILNCLSLIMFLTAGVMAYAYVYDIDVFGPEKYYELERDIYNRHRDFASHEFPSFGQWLEEQDAREKRRDAWIQSVLNEIGQQCAETFDPWYSRPYDTAAAPPEDWHKGERD